MDIKNNLLFQLTKNVLARNKKFKNKHKGESCYIFGNGASLKSMDLEKFSDKVAIGCNFLCLHKDFRALDIRYYMLVEPFFLYPIFKNPYTKQLQVNHLGAVFKEAIKPHRDVDVFTSVSNYFGFGGSNFYYLHHFGEREPSLNYCELDSCFSFMKGALYAMLGAAIYMGFDRAILVGCDYTFAPHKDNHFYKPGKGVINLDTENIYAKLFEEASKRIDMITVTEDGSKSETLKYQEYGQFTMSAAKYRDNDELVELGYLAMLQKAAMKRQIQLV